MLPDSPVSRAPTTPVGIHDVTFREASGEDDRPALSPEQEEQVILQL